MLQIAYQYPDFTVDELGPCSAAELIGLIESKDWLHDLMQFASLNQLQKDCCSPNFSACIKEQVNATIMPTGLNLFAAIFGVNHGSGFFSRWVEVTHERVSIERLASLLKAMEEGDIEALEQN